MFVGGKNAERLGVAAGIALAISAFLVVARESEALGPAMERMTVLLFQREADESFQARQTLLIEGLNYLRENWVLGRFLDEWWRSGVGGNYMHNWLSFWQSYGLFPFLASLLLFAVIGIRLFKQLGKPRLTTGVAMALFTYAMLAMITARGYSWPFIWLALGVAATAVYSRKEESRLVDSSRARA
jgi:O-antigen ligase